MSGFRVRKNEDAELVRYGPLSDVRVLIGDDDGRTPIRAAMQVCRPGYDVPFHCHPYTEFLIVIEGTAEFRIEQPEGGLRTLVLGKGDTVEMEAGTWHAFGPAGDEDAHLLGVHVSPKRIVNYRSGVKTDARGFRVD